MKNTIVIIAALIISCSSLFAQGIEFYHGTFAEALSKAKTENKMVFMDCFTTWCGPCKMLAKDVFPLQEVGDYFNQYFVCVKMDMEKGEGKVLAKKYSVQAFPTLLFLDADGNVLHTKVGGTDGQGLIEQAKIASDPSRQIGALTKKYDEGERGVKFLSDYVKALANAYQMDKIAEVGKEFIKETPVEQMLNADALTIIGYSGILEYESSVCRFIIDNKDKYISLDGVSEEDIDRVLTGAIGNYYSQMASNGSISEIEKAITTTKKDYTPVYQDYLESNAFQTYYLVHKEFDNWFKYSVSHAEEVMKTDKDRGASMVIQSAFEVGVRPEFENATGLAEKAAKYIEKLMKASENDLVSGYFCLANLYKRIGNKELALQNVNSYISKSKDQSARAIKLKAEIEAM